jgi:hypothetical protein
MNTFTINYLPCEAWKAFSSNCFSITIITSFFGVFRLNLICAKRFESDGKAWGKFCCSLAKWKLRCKTVQLRKQLGNGEKLELRSAWIFVAFILKLEKLLLIIGFAGF